MKPEACGDRDPAAHIERTEQVVPALFVVDVEMVNDQGGRHGWVS